MGVWVEEEKSSSGPVTALAPVREVTVETPLWDRPIFWVLPGTATDKSLMKFSRAERVLVHRFRKMGYEYPYLPEDLMRRAEKHRMERVEEAIIAHLDHTAKDSRYHDLDRAKHLLRIWVVGRNVHLDRVEYISGKRRCYSVRVPDGQGNMVKEPDPAHYY
ncbi:hypothetical protein FKM82_031013 [Ascaphus truei]